MNTSEVAARLRELHKRVRELKQKHAELTNERNKMVFANLDIKGADDVLAAKRIAMCTEHATKIIADGLYSQCVDLELDETNATVYIGKVSENEATAIVCNVARFLGPNSAVWLDTSDDECIAFNFFQ